MIFKFNPLSGLIIIPVRFWGPKGDAIIQMALDTGASQTLINWDIAILLGYDPAAVRKRVKIATASGLEFAPKMTVTKIQALGVVKNNFSLLCHTLPQSTNVEGLLGLDFFRNTVLKLDFIKGHIHL